uniref:non-specific serine/threonine protein kinase n=1 Tax=Oryza punctata TaxID=4537 RepID=A0A0E0KVN9_ORYPU
MACLSHLPVYLLLISFCKCDDQLRHAKRLISPSDMLISKGGDFALGFFSPATSNQSLFLGIWYHNISERTYVWVANRDNPIAASSSATLSISNNSALADSKGRILWTTMASPSTITGDDGVYAVLLDSGNLVLRLSNNTTIWQSFDHPTDTVLPNMKVLLRSNTQVAMRFIAWKGPDDPSTGDFSCSGDPTSNFQYFIWHGTRPYYRFIKLDSVSVTGAAYEHNATSFAYETVVNTKDEFSIEYTTSDDSQYTRVMIDYVGNFRFMSWNGSLSSWTVVTQLPAAIGCDTYGSCGPFGYCDRTLAVPSCQCLDWFEPVGSNSSSRGCQRKQQLRCGDDHFEIMSRMKVPDKFLHVQNRNFDECTDECTRNCSCTAYAYTNLTATGTISNQPRCLLWTGELSDTARDIRDIIGENLYLRLADSTGSNSTVNRKKKRRMVVNIVLPAIVCLLILTACIYLVSKCIRQNKEKTKTPVVQQLSTIHDLWDQNMELPCISFEDITAATDSFHETHMLGKGGFGKVYKVGTLKDGKEIAVKRLSKSSEQGMEQFRNELVLIAKLQHKNLVRLLGCCIHGDEKLLIYEYLPNKSLDKFIFNHTREATLDWPIRFNIIKGVARGLLYLHQDSRMTIIHRDLKASNILLDAEMNPKISDFGMARIFGGNEQQESTKRVVGTYGYMSPEYAMEGIFSVKSDTYSFGILLLEIVSGLKISSPHHLVMDFPNLIAYAWNLWKDGRQRDFVDQLVLESCSLNEVFKCIHIGLLCVQDSPNARPLMSFVVSMLENKDMPQPIPTQPIYFVQRHYEAEEPREYSKKSVNNKNSAVMEAATANIFHLSLTFFSVVLLSLRTSAAGVASDTLSNGRNLTDGNTLVSAGGSFTLGFFSPGLPTRRYLAIWFSESKDAVWVANRDSPLNDTTGVLVINGAGGLVLLDGSGRAAWSSNTTGTSSSATAAQLNESGNLVVRDQGSGDTLWQSFDHPSNTLIAGMRFGKNPRTGDEWFLTSWRARDDPATGDCRRVLDTRGLPDCVTWCGGAKKYRTGPWNGQWFSGVPEMESYASTFSSQVVVRPDEIAYFFSAASGAPFSRLVLNDVGETERLVWDRNSKGWIPYMKAPRDVVCDDYAKCGAFGLCNEDTASTLFCSCMPGFSPVSPSQWSMRETSGGCRRNTPLECGNGSTTDGFVPVRGVKLPDTDNATVDMGATLDECRSRCLANCSCVAYAAADIRDRGGGSGCVMWIGDMVDVRYVEKGQDLHVRLAKSELVNNKKRAVIKILPPVTAACLLLLMSIFLVWLCKCRGKCHQKKVVQKRGMLGYLSTSNELGDENLELPFVSFGEIAAATNNFSDDNMLGQGGFGKVYKGMLDDGKEVAIKRLSKGSGQGVEEFRNEVVLIAKLQHRNLVRLLGYCIYGDEKLLIYEYLPNKSLDAFIFDHANKYVLDWPTRFKIIKGVARGLLYLHQDSRLTVIHRDLKSSNILLDVDMSPKISDFGMARIFGGNQHEANTNRVVGTYGYMSPEYAMDGAFSVKSDAYSFGVILLEIVSSLKISLPRLMDFPNLLAYAWNLWKNDRAMDLMDSSIAKSCSPTEVLLCIQIGLLCVQDNPNNRPFMSSVVSMLENETTALSAPIQPVYFAHRAFEGRQTGENSNSLLEGRTSSATAARLLESGNLVVRDQSSGGGDTLWQSFDHPSNTLIAGMRFGNNPQTGAEWSLTSWRAPSDPATGDYRRVLGMRGPLPDSVLWRRATNKYRMGPWNGLWFSGVPEMESYSPLFTNQMVVKPDEVAYVFATATGAPFSRAPRVGSQPQGVEHAPRDVCDDNAKCGAFGLCNVNTASTLFCSCMPGFSPVSPSRWSMRDTSGGCRRNAPLECGNGSTTDGFVPVRGVKLPDTDNATVDMGATLDECRARCLANCSCVAYAAADIRGGGGGSGCVIWTGDIVDVRYVDKGQDLYVRLAKSELVFLVNNKKKIVIKVLLPVTATAACLLLLTSIFLVWIYKCRGNRRNNVVQHKRMLGDENLELPFVSFGDIAAATNNFSDDNMLGRGGFGKVYKGKLDNCKEVAIKRLCEGSGQGVEEFRNEVVLIAKLQHRNLVRLLGCCIHGDEKLLIYEYLPNRSLDAFISDPTSKYVLDWPTRFKIIKGVARGLLYLHQDSRLTIIHRDLKSSNILLDVDMSPKISDFGMARIFGGNQQEANTNRVVGTYGYISPEYAMDGAFSVKSDTYSYGVILLEIVSGLKISLPRLTDFPNLLAYWDALSPYKFKLIVPISYGLNSTVQAWSLWKDDKAMDLVDSYPLLRVAQKWKFYYACCACKNNRPLMSSIVFMLENEAAALPSPIQPLYFAHRASEANQSGENTSSSNKNMSLTPHRAQHSQVNNKA